LTAQQVNHNAASARGVYAYSLNIAEENSPSSPDASLLLQALAEPGTDGFTLVRNWSSIEPTRGVYEWDLAPPNQSNLDQWLALAVATGKKVNLAIRAGADEPSWLFDPITDGGAGATPFHFLASPHQGESRTTCRRVNIAAPWDPTFLSISRPPEHTMQ
jgi:hypothetical protein